MTSTKKNMQSGCKTKIREIIKGFLRQTLGVLHDTVTGESSEMGRECVCP